jgi:hypothetical protein
MPFGGKALHLKGYRISVLLFARKWFYAESVRWLWRKACLFCPLHQLFSFVPKCVQSQDIEGPTCLTLGNELWKVCFYPKLRQVFMLLL